MLITSLCVIRRLVGQGVDRLPKVRLQLRGMRHGASAEGTVLHTLPGAEMITRCACLVANLHACLLCMPAAVRIRLNQLQTVH